MLRMERNTAIASKMFRIPGMRKAKRTAAHSSSHELIRIPARLPAATEVTIRLARLFSCSFSYIAVIVHKMELQSMDCA